MTRRIDRFVSENRNEIDRINATFVPVSGQTNQTLSFTNSEIEIGVQIEVYKRSLGNSLISGHPDTQHGSGNGVSGDDRGSWSLLEDVEDSENFVQGGRNNTRDALAGESQANFGKTAIGTGNGSVTPSDTSLDSETSRVFAWGEQGGQSNQAVSKSIFLFSQHGQDVSEFGVYSEDGTLYNRIVTPSLTPDLETELRVETQFTVKGYGIGDSVITDTGEDQIAKSLRTPQSIGADEIAFGDGTTSPSASDTALDNELLRKTAEKLKSPEVLTVQTLVFDNEATGQDISEIGVFDNDGNLLWRIVIDTFSKTSEKEFEAVCGYRIK